MLESESYVLARLEQIGMSRLKPTSSLWLAFCCSTVPGGEEAAFKEFATKLRSGRARR